MAQAEGGLTDKDLTMAIADSIQMQEKDEERINKMRIKAAHRRRWKLQYSKELKRQKEGQRRQASDRCSDEELVTIRGSRVGVRFCRYRSNTAVTLVEAKSQVTLTS